MIIADDMTVESDSIFSDRIVDVPRSFIREILKDALYPGVISFAGGLPNRDYFPVEELREATDVVFTKYGADSLQYSSSEGFLPLRKFIAERYAKQGLNIPPEKILITTGSQQGLDLIGKVLLNEGDGLLIEEPGYLGAIQSFSLYRPRFFPIPVSESGADVAVIKKALATGNAKLMYSVPNFQNPSGLSYPENNRRELVAAIKNSPLFFIEDDPYGDLRFSGKRPLSFYSLIPDQTILLGSFSKVIVPGFRIGWMVAPENIMDRLIVAKQAADLHTTQFLQCVLYEYLQNNDLDEHIQKICHAYGKQKNVMLEAIQENFPVGVSYTTPEGGMFLWVTIPEGKKAMDLFPLAVKEGVVFVPGDPFYTSRKSTNTFRLNFSCSDPETIKKGIAILGKVLNEI